MHALLIVIYKCRLDESPTLTSIFELEDVSNIEIVVWDNSPEDFKQISDPKSFIANLGASKSTYLADGKNHSLSIVYNKVVNNLFQSGLNVVTLLDQDSVLPDDFLKHICADAYSDTLIVPRVRSVVTNAMISPRYQKNINFLPTAGPMLFVEEEFCGYTSSKGLFAVGSGFTISTKVWSAGIRFQEKLPLYGVDTEFLIQYSQKFDNVYVADINILHEVSTEKELSNNEKIMRRNMFFIYWQFQLQKYYLLPELAARYLVLLWKIASSMKLILKKLCKI